MKFSKHLMAILAGGMILTACSGDNAGLPSEAASDASELAKAVASDAKEATSEIKSEAVEAVVSTASELGASEYKVAEHTTYPYTMNACGRELTFKESPKRVVSIGLATVPNLIDLGLQDRIVGMTQEVPKNTYPAEMEKTMEGLPRLASSKTGGGGVEVSNETILAAEANMTIGPDKNPDWNQLAQAGVQGYSQPGYCKNKTPKAAELKDIHAVYDELAAIFDVPEAAAKAKKKVDDRIAAATKDAPKDAGTAAVLYITPGETVIWTYGQASMANVMMEQAGLKNLYADKPERVFEVNLEDVLAKDPDYLVIVNIGYTKDETLDAFKKMGNIDTLKAVKNNKITAMPWAWTDPASSLVVNGVEELADFVKKTQ